MKNRGVRGSRGLALGSAIAVLSVVPLAQEKEDRTLLTTEQMNAIIKEASGERAMHHVLELVPYQFVRPPAEYQGHFRESEVMVKFARDGRSPHSGNRRNDQAGAEIGFSREDEKSSRRAGLTRGEACPVGP
jgi:hypothetical protein